ncbi:MAG: helix-turn-helix domain-containing protein [Pseudobdellovibrionaceae bacterium]|nr:helix-turn-helix domain-containing protein [Pseudobdellovibrionaceae bacterium]
MKKNMQLTEAEVDSLSNRIAPINNSRNVRWDRGEYAEKVAALESLLDQGLSDRAIARELDVPRSTLQAWKQHRGSLDAESEFIAFFESSLGMAFLHRLCTAAHLVFVEAGACGVAMVSKFLQLSCLDRFVACSVESQRQVNRSVQDVVIAYVAAEQPILQSKMPEKEITVCQDETFTGGLCLVAIEPESGFILLEKKAENRTCETWTTQMSEAMQGMKAKIIQSTSDEGKGLLAYAEHTLGVTHSPDIFHVQHELCKAIAAPIAIKIRRSERSVQSANDE